MGSKNQTKKVVPPDSSPSDSSAETVQAVRADNSPRTSLRQILGIVILLVLIGANVFFFMPTNSAQSQAKPTVTAQNNHPKATGPEAERVFGPARETFGEGTVEDDKIKPLPLDLVEEKSAATSKTKGPIPDSVKADADSQGNGDDNDEGIPPTSKDSGPAADTTTLLNGADIEIATLVKAFSKLTKRNYIVDNNVKGKVTVHLTTPVSSEESIHIFESILLLKGFTTVPIGKNVWKVIATKDAQKSTIPFIEGGSANPSEVLVTQLIRLKYTQANELQTVMNQFVSKDGLLSSFAGTNSLIIIDSESNIKRIVELINQLDVPAIDQDITIIPILHADAKDVAEKLKQILGEDKDAKDASARAALNPQNMARPVAFVPPTGGSPITATGQQAFASSLGEKRALPLKIIADERTNSVIVVADAMLTTKVRALCEQLDSRTDQSGGKFYVYRLKHADAEELSGILNSLISGSGGSGGGASTGGTSGSKSKSKGSSLSRGGSSGSNSNSSRSGSSSSMRGASALTSTGADGTPGAASGQSGKVAFDGDISISPDSATNSLVINCSKADYEKIKQVIEELDVRRQQVLVEATILQVSLDNNESTGVEWQTSLGNDNFGAIGQNNFGGLTNLISNPAALSDLTIAAASSGSIILPGGIALPSQAALITALSRNTNVNVLSSPTILATDNQEAEIVVGQNVPFVTSTSTNATNLNNTFNSIQRQDVGITLRITPQISAGGFVVLKIFVEVSNVVSGTQNDANGPTTSVNTTETTVEVKSNQMIVTGGLISDEVTDSVRGVPWLKDVPILGNLFRTDRSTRKRNNLLLFITPKVISDQFIAREETKARTGNFSQEIEKIGTEPDRSEVLNSNNIDQVAEEIPTPAIRPSTVQPPKGGPTINEDDKAAKARTQERLNSLFGPVGDEEKERPRLEESQPVENSPPAKSQAIEEEELSFSVKPKLPSEGSSSPNTLARARSASSEPIALKQEPSSGRSYVVLRQIGGDKNARVPFHYADENQTVGISVMGSTGSVPGRFFSAGKRYLFRNGEEDVQFVCLGVFASPTEASTIEPSLGTASPWYNLDSAQSLQLGRNQWRAF